jgi:hypothetical protein
MARKRGRPRLKDEDRKSAPIGVRLTPALREQLEAARHHPEGAIQISQEIERRLRESFHLETNVKKRFGSDDNYAFLLLVAEGIAQIERESFGAQKRWFFDRYMFEQVRSMIDAMLDYYVPKGRSVTPKRLRALPDFAESLGQYVAAYITASIDPAGPQNDYGTLVKFGIRRTGAIAANARLALGTRLTGTPLKDLAERYEKLQREIGKLPEGRSKS